MRDEKLNTGQNEQTIQEENMSIDPADGETIALDAAKESEAPTPDGKLKMPKASASEQGMQPECEKASYEHPLAALEAEQRTWPFLVMK